MFNILPAIGINRICKQPISIYLERKSILKLDKEEKDILDSFNRGEWKSVNSQTDYATIAKSSLQKDKRINIRLSQMDLSALQQLAVKMGMPYQTLIGSILHRYVTGDLK
jgi:predicted DNA binding CopG/RHH family protein